MEEDKNNKMQNMLFESKLSKYLETNQEKKEINYLAHLKSPKETDSCFFPRFCRFTILSHFSKGPDAIAELGTSRPLISMAT